VAVMDYQTQDGLDDYGFSIEFESTIGWRVYNVFPPFQEGHGDSLQLPYQSIDVNGRRYVNWPDRLNNLGDAKAVAALWAELVQRYRRTHEQHSLYVELIKDHLRSQEQRANPPAPNRLGVAVGAGGAEFETRIAVPSSHSLGPQQNNQVSSTRASEWFVANEVA
jgi:hypothetical protein